MLRTPNALPSRRTAGFVLHVGQRNGFLARGFLAGTRRKPDTDLSTARAGTVGAPVPLACGSWRRLAARHGFWLSAGQRARDRVDAAADDPSYRRAKFCRERQRGRRSPLLPGAGAVTQSHLAAPCDAARLARVPP